MEHWDHNPDGLYHQHDLPWENGMRNFPENPVGPREVSVKNMVLVLSPTTLSPTWEVVVAPWSIASIGFSLELGIKSGGNPCTLMDCLKSASLYSSFLT